MANIESLEKQVFPTGEQQLEDILKRDPSFWEAYAEESESPVLGEHTGGVSKFRIITGTTEAGNSVIVRDIDHQIYYRHSRAGVSSNVRVDASNGEALQYKKGVSIEVVSPTTEGKSRSVEAYIPDDPHAHPEIEDPYAITLKEDGIAKKIVPAENPVPEDEGLFDKGMAGIEYHLGDRVIWDSPESKDILTPASSEAPADF